MKRRLLSTLALTLACAALPASARAAECHVQPTTQAFAAWGDTASYYLAPGGDFEGQLAWSTRGDVRQLEGQNRSGLGAPTVLKLGEGGATTSPPFCVDDLHPQLRLLARGPKDGVLLIEGLRASGPPVRLALLVAVGEQWSAPQAGLSNSLGLAPGESEDVSLRLVARSGDWRVDAVHIDPWVRR